jgi:hypothetical protein
VLHLKGMVVRITIPTILIQCNGAGHKYIHTQLKKLIWMNLRRRRDVDKPTQVDGQL